MHVTQPTPATLRPEWQQSWEPPGGSDTQTTTPGAQDPRDRERLGPSGHRPAGRAHGSLHALTVRARKSCVIGVKSQVSLPSLRVCGGLCL